jgi:predicted enzyme related to lactoylglutathione lyase
LPTAGTPSGSRTLTAPYRPRMSDITGVDFVAIQVRDHARAAEFYGETLGLPFVKAWGKLPASEFQAGDLTLAVMQSDAFGLEFAPSTAMVALAVDDVEATRSRLEARGVAFRGGILDSGVCHQAFFADPDGNPLALHHRYAAKDPQPSQ